MIMRRFFKRKLKSIETEESPSSTTTTPTSLPTSFDILEKSTETLLPIQANITNSDFPHSDEEGSETETEQKQKKRKLSTLPPVISETVVQEAPKKQNGYLICDKKQKVSLLIELLKKNASTKRLLVLFNSPQSALFYGALLDHLDIMRPFVYTYSQDKNEIESLNDFKAASSGVLFLVRSPLPELQFDFHFDCIYQFELLNLDDKKLDTFKTHQRIQFLYPHEVSFFQVLQPDFKKLTFSTAKVLPLDQKIEALVKKNYFIYRLAWYGYRSMLPFYAKMYREKEELKDHVEELPFYIASAFGFVVPPRIKF